MKKLLKFSLWVFIYLIIIFLLAIMFIITAKAETLKPNDDIIHLFLMTKLLLLPK